jgi:hypothetical protein
LLLRRLAFLALAVMATLAIAACGGDGDDFDTDYPSAGEDRFESTKATVQLEVTAPGVSALPVALGALETVELQGPLLVKRGDPQDEDGDGNVEVPTEIVEMSLSGAASFGPVTVRESPDRESKGMVEQRESGQDFPADSFFDVFVEIDIEDINGFTVHNEEPLRMEATLTDLPPAEGDEYLDAQGRPLPIYTEAGIEIGRVIDALHVPNPPPGPGPGGGGTPTATATAEPQETPEETPTGPAGEEQISVTQQPGCEHPIGASQSDLVDLVLAFLVGASPQSGVPVEPPRLVLSIDDPALDAATSPPGLKEPLAGATILAHAEGPGVIQPNQTAVTDANGAARLRFPISQLGEYTITIDSVQPAGGATYPLAADSQLAASFTVGSTCTLPEGF